jgi:hypothetical protein
VGGEFIPFKDVNTRITEDELFNELKLYLSEKNNNSLQIKNNNSLKIWKEFRIDFDKAFPKKETDYLMATIFSDCILDKLYIKNIDYYSLTMMICDLYDAFTYYYVIVEDTTKHSKRLPELFKELKDKFNDNSIEKDYFLKQLDLIISVIKE